MNALVSIIIPAFNRAHLIAKTLDSISAQTYTNWECIVVDDGSSDATVAVVNVYVEKDARFKLYKRPSHLPKGANACRNYGLLKARGVYINWFDSDDLMMPCKLTIQVNQLEHSAFNYAICQTERFDSETKTSLGLRASAIYSKDVLNDYILFKIFWMTGAPLWRKDFLIGNKIAFDPVLQQSQDYDYHINILALDVNYVFTNEPLMQLIKHGGNMSNNLYDNPLKIYSNIKARRQALINHTSLLTATAKSFLFSKAFQYYVTGIVALDWRYTFKSLLLVAQSFRIVAVRPKVFYKHVINWFLGSLSYRLLNKGERFFKTPTA